MTALYYEVPTGRLAVLIPDGDLRRAVAHLSAVVQAAGMDPNGYWYCGPWR